MTRDDWVTVDQAAERVGRSRSTVYRWIGEGTVRTMRPMRTLWVNVPDLLVAERDATSRIGRPRNVPGL